MKDKIKKLKQLLKETKSPHKRDRIKYLLNKLYEIRKKTCQMSYPQV